MQDVCIFYCIYFLFQLETWSESNEIKKEVVNSSSVIRMYKEKTHIKVCAINRYYGVPPSNITIFIPNATIEACDGFEEQLKTRKTNN